MPSALHSFFDIKPSSSSSKVTSPAPTYQKDKQIPSSLRDVGILPDVELDTITSAGKNDEHTTPELYTPPRGAPTPKTPHELEMSRPGSPGAEEGVGLVRTWNSPPMTKWRILCCCMIYLTNGINDSVVGALIPYMEAYYHISYTIISLVFVGTAVGFITAAFFTDIILSKIGRAKTLIASVTLQLCAYVIIVCTPPYPLIVFSFFLLGYGAAIGLALNNVYCAHTHPPSVILGLGHGSYGVGGIIAPIIGTTMVSNGILWSRFYCISLVLCILCIVFVIFAFWGYEEESEPNLLTALEVTTSRQSAATNAATKFKDLKYALHNKVTIFGALFIFAYQGAEVAISGWIISYLIKYRDGDPAKVGYVTAGFWTGITLGRFVLTHLAPKVGERKFVVILTIGSAVLQLLAWLVPNVIGNAVAVALLGLLLGPVYPCAQTIFSRALPRHLQTTAVGFIAGAGSSGGAVAPFTTGILAQAVGTWVLHPVCLGLYVAMMACWFAIPRISKRKE